MAKLPKAVIEIGQMHIEGNIIPHSWYSHLAFQNGKPQLAAIHILSDILYWYRPTEIRDEGTGKVIGHKKKFKADKLQRSYQYYVDLYGFGKDQVRNAVDYLVDFGVITREFRHFTSKTGMPMSNVMFVEPIPEKLKEITYSHLDNDHIGIETDMGGHENQDGMSTETDTYTEITTETTHDNVPNGTNSLPKLTAHEQDELLVYGLYGHNGNQPEPQSTKEKIIDSGWHVRSPVILQALIDFLEACQEIDHALLLPNSDLRRKDWYKSLKGHTEDFDPDTLKQRYLSVLKRAKSEGWINKVSRPGSLDKTLPTADMSQLNGKSDVADYTQDKQYQFFAELEND